MDLTLSGARQRCAEEAGQRRAEKLFGEGQNPALISIFPTYLIHTECYVDLQSESAAADVTASQPEVAALIKNVSHKSPIHISY